MKNNNSWVDIAATLTILAALIAGGYLYLRFEADKIIQHKAQPEQKYEKVGLEKWAPKTFEVLSKRTE